MFRHSLLPRACLSLALGCAVLAVAPAAQAQDRSAEERLDRLERDLNMLQRQVYRGAPPMIGGGEAVNTAVRMDRIEAQMRDLTGRIEEVGNMVERLHQRLERIDNDLEARLGQPGTAPGALASAGSPRPGAMPPPARGALPFPPPPLGDSDEDPAPPRPGRGLGPTAMVPPERGAPSNGGPTPIAGTLTPPGASAPSPDPAAAAAGRPPTGVLPSGSATEQYNYAFGLLKRADYPAAETALKAFVERHPRDQMAGNAQYWLGETYYTRGRYLEAAAAFAEGYKRYPKSSKAADDLLKLSMSLARADQKQNACVALAQLDRDFPQPGASVKERAHAEKKRLGC